MRMIAKAKRRKCKALIVMVGSLRISPIVCLSGLTEIFDVVFAVCPSNPQKRLLRYE
jgi:hypothetical protein